MVIFFVEKDRSFYPPVVHLVLVFLSSCLPTEHSYATLNTYRLAFMLILSKEVGVCWRDFLVGC